MAGAAATVSVTRVGTVGSVLVDASGMTVYRYTPDGTGSPTCTGSCATAWPPVTVPAGTAHVAGGSGIATGSLGTVARSDGTLQVTYKGMPLYRYSGDTQAGQANGQGAGGIWYVITVTSTPAAPTTTAARPASGY